MKILLKITIVSLFLFSISHSGTFIDPRDEQEYSTVKIGDLEWMAENLNYETEYSICYEKKIENCSLFGRFYDWNEAMMACPEGWHLPSKRDFLSLTAAVRDIDLLGKKLKSDSRWDGFNELGFKAVPGGYCLYADKYKSLYCVERGERAFFWSSERINQDSSYGMILRTGWSGVGLDKFAILLHEGEKISAIYNFSVRCVRKNTEVTEHYASFTGYREEETPPKPTAICRDGTPSYSQTRSGSCSGHGGVEKWVDSEEKQNAKQNSNEVEKRYESPIYNREEYSPPQPTAICADGTTSYSQDRRGTCSKHGGVDSWENSEKKQKSKPSDLGVGSLLKLFF